MLDDSDYNALMSSEVFRAFYAQEMRKEAEAKANEKTLLEKLEHDIDNKYNAFKAFAEFEQKVKNNAALTAKFKQIKEVLASNPDIAKKTDARFVQAVMMLNLGDE